MATGRETIYTGASANDGTGATLRDVVTSVNRQTAELYDAVAANRTVRLRSRTTAVQPSSPVIGDAYIVPVGATGTWAAQAGKIGIYEGTSGWVYVTPSDGWTAWVADEAVEIRLIGAAWTTAFGVSSGKLVATFAAATLAGLAGLSLGSSAFPYVNAAGVYSSATVTPAALALLDDTDAPTMRSTLGLGSAAVPQFAGAVIGHTAQLAAAGGTAPVQIHSAGGAGIFQWTANNTPPFLTFAKSRAGTPGGAATAVTSGDFLMNVQAAGDDGSALLASGAMYFVVDGSVSTGLVPTRWGLQVRTSVGLQDAVGVDSSRRVLVGHTASLSVPGTSPMLQVHSGTGSGVAIYRWGATNIAPYLSFAKSRSATVGTLGTSVQSGDYLMFINASADDGTQLLSAGMMYFVVDGSPSVGTMPSRFGVQVNTGTGLSDALSIASTRHVTPGSDNQQTLGSASLRWSVVYAGTATISTSDAREKRWHGAMSAELLAAGRAIGAKLGMFQWLDAISLKGEDDARIHLGLTAQVVEKAFRSAGLDPERYALWTRTPLTRLREEIHVETVDGVEHRRTVTREEPVMVRDPQKGMVQQVRYGLRQDHVSMLLHATSFARMDSIEARLTSLEQRAAGQSGA